MQAKLVAAKGWGMRWTQNVQREIYVNWLFIKRDLWVSLVPGLIFLLVAWSVQDASSQGDLLSALKGGAVYFTLYIYTFCVANQMVGIESDRINKPDRPLCRGLLSYRGAKYRWIGSMALFSAIAWHLGVFEWALLWQICILVLNFGGLCQEWPTKHFFLGLGQIAQMAAAWQIIAPITPVTWSWILLVTSLSIPLFGIQDLPDIPGDMATGQNTLAIAFGENAARGMLFVGFFLLPVAIHFGLMMPAGWNIYLLLWDVAQAIVSWSVSLRLLFYSTPEDDRQTYLLALCWYYLALGSASAGF